MLENIREKYRKRVKEVKADDVKTCKNHPRTWLGLMLFYAIFWMGLSIYMTIMDISAIILVIVFSPILYYIEKTMFDRYRKAFPKQS